MKYDHQPQPSDGSECSRTQLATSSIGSVEVCGCGMWQLHVGAVTLRLAPCAVSELLGLLGHAVAEHSALRVAKRDDVQGVGLGPGRSFVAAKRGQA